MTAGSLIDRLIKRPYTALLGFVTREEDPASLALVRIAAGGVLFVHLVRMVTSGAAAFAWSTDYNGRANGLLFEAIGASSANIIAVCCAAAAAAFLVCVGFMTRPSILVAMVLYRWLYESSTDARGSYDILLVNALFLLLFSGCGRAFSVDAWRRQRRGLPAQEAQRWPRMLLVFQIGLLYGGSAIMKMSNGWVPGGDADALWYILHQPMWARFEVPAWTFPLTQVATTSVWLFELCGPAFALVVFLRERPGRSTRWLRIFTIARNFYLAFGVAMHLGIEISMDVGAFTGASLALYFAAIAPSEWRAIIARIGAITASSRTSR